MTTTNAPANFSKDLDRLAKALVPYVIELEDGDLAIRPDAPESLTRPYGQLCQMGYANGWIK